MKKKVKKAPKEIKKEKETPPVNPNEEADFNFGGLPQRDLKKNLGCG